VKKKILLVDDEEDILTLIGKKISKWDYDVMEAANGKEALDVLISKHPDIVILDYMMPGMDGIETLKEIRKISKNIPVIMFTAFPDKKSMDEVKALGVCAYIPKLSVLSSSISALKEALRVAEKTIKI
jgi:two-component system nitrogen regulation response regulator NtrX